MSDLFSSPGKQAQQAGNITAGEMNQEIGDLETYVGNTQKAERSAIAGMPLSPTNDVAFGNTGPGLVSGSSSYTPGSGVPSTASNVFAPPSPQKPVPPTSYSGNAGNNGGQRRQTQ
jgi:hypothetical protein